MSEISAEEFDRRFDEGEDVEEFLDMSAPVVHRAKPQRVVINPPAWLLDFYDGEAKRRGIPRRSVINTALVEWADGQRERESRLGRPA